MDGTQPNRFGPWLKQQLGERTYGQIAEYVGVSTSTVSRWVTGESQPEYRNVLRVARYLKVEPEGIEAMLGRDGGPGEPDVAAQLAQIREAVEEIRAIQLSGRPVGVAWAGPDLIEAPAIPGLRGRLEPYRVPDDALIGQGIRAGSVAWVDPEADPAPGDVVRVGLDDAARLKLFEAGDAPTGKVRLVQTTL